MQTSDHTQYLLFNTQQYLVFFTIVFSAYWLIRHARLRVWILLAASIYFYAVMSKRMAALVCLTTLFDYLIARRLETLEGPRWRKSLLVFSVTVNLGVLCF